MSDLAERRRQQDAARANDPDRRFRNSRLWKDYISPRTLAAEPLCRHCRLLGVVTAATEVDHIHRPHGDQVLQRHPQNLQPLCNPCHVRKSNWERGDTSRPLVLGHTADGWPVTWTLPAKPAGEGFGLG